MGVKQGCPFSRAPFLFVVLMSLGSLDRAMLARAKLRFRTITSTSTSGAKVPDCGCVVSFAGPFN